MDRGARDRVPRGNAGDVVNRPNLDPGERAVGGIEFRTVDGSLKVFVHGACGQCLVSWDEDDAVDEGRGGVAVGPEVCGARKACEKRDVVIARRHDSARDVLRTRRDVTQRDRRRACGAIHRPALDAPLLVGVNQRCAAELLVAVGRGRSLNHDLLRGWERPRHARGREDDVCAVA